MAFSVWDTPNRKYPCGSRVAMNFTAPSQNAQVPSKSHDGALINAAGAWACVEGSRYQKPLRLDVHRHHHAGARHRVVQVVSELQGERVLARRQLSVEFRLAIAEMHP